MASSKVILLLGLAFLAVVLISSKAVYARDLAETTQTDDFGGHGGYGGGKGYGGGRGGGGHGGGGHGGHPGHEVSLSKKTKNRDSEAGCGTVNMQGLY
ncbi:hypothetical protein CDL15_Pgr019538 [Punica granatum]|uniref:Uncharacterized protein n=1 Tax=Punica granatum TaxID=22663 RepID=A0A218X643_PUNGR|nr:hypothetical protein CDL15_Pgr019538 [Punica granatum]PKI31324.1 hypothetical protein CRG98_048285 [Punica granatum]